MGFIKISFKPFHYYFYYFLKDHFLFCGLGIGGYFIFHGLTHSHHIKLPVLNLFSFFAGFFFLVSIKDFFTYSGGYNVYLLFILPLLRLFTIIIISYLLDKFIEALGLEKILFGAFLFLVPVSAGFVSFFYNLNMVVLAFLLSLALFIGSGAVHYFLKDI